MGFLKWLYVQYQTYKLATTLPKRKSDEEFMEHFKRFMDLGFTESQFLAIANFVDFMTRKDV